MSVAVALVIVVLTIVARERAWWALGAARGLCRARGRCSWPPAARPCSEPRSAWRTDFRPTRSAPWCCASDSLTLPVLGAPHPLGKRRRIPGRALLPDRVLATRLPAFAVALICVSGLTSLVVVRRGAGTSTTPARAISATIDDELWRRPARSTWSTTGTRRRAAGCLLRSRQPGQQPRGSAAAGQLTFRGQRPRSRSSPRMDRCTRPSVGPRSPLPPARIRTVAGWGPRRGSRSRLSGSTYDLDWWVRIGYLSNRADSVTITLGDDRIETRLVKGLANLYVHTEGVFDSVVISDLAPDTKVCVDVVEVGTLTEGRRLYQDGVGRRRPGPATSGDLPGPRHAARRRSPGRADHAHRLLGRGVHRDTAPGARLLARLDVGVAIFFVLSGFLLSRPWIARAYAGLPAPSVGRATSGSGSCASSPCTS